MKKQIALIIISLLAAMPAAAQNIKDGNSCSRNDFHEECFCYNNCQNSIFGDCSDSFPGCGFENQQIPTFPPLNQWDDNICQKPPIEETPDAPVIPDIPNEPQEPEIPDIPIVPDTPDKPEMPDSPDVPTPPDTPIIPEVPEEVLPESGSNTPSDERIIELLALVNQARLKSGIKALTYNKSLEVAASIRSKEIKKLFSHTRPDGSRCFTVLDEIGYDYKSAGENIAYGQQSASEVFNDWMNSEGHRQNILNPSYTLIGMACYNSGVLYWAQMFSDR